MRWSEQDLLDYQNRRAAVDATPAPQRIIVELAGEPEGAGRPRFVRSSGIAFTPAKTRAYQSALRYAAQKAMEGRPPIEGPVHIHLTAAFPIPQSWSKKKRLEAENGEHFAMVRPDSDNIIKNFCDSLNEVVYRDDKQVVSLTFSKMYSTKPRLIGAITPL